MQPGDVDCTFADTAKAQELLGYHPSVDFRDGIREFLTWMDRLDSE